MSTIEYYARPGSSIDLVLREYSEEQFAQFMMMIEHGVSDDVLLKKAWNFFINDAGGDLHEMPISNHALGDVTAWIMVNDFLVSAMMCVVCNVIKPRSIDFFFINKSTDMEQWMKQRLPGLEPFRNSDKTPCKLCYPRVNTLYRETPRGYFNVLAGNYNFTSQDLLNLYKNLERGLVSDMPAKFLFAQIGHPLKVGVHEIVRENWDNGKNHNQKDHKLENCVLDLAVKNVQQRDRIPDLIAAVTRTYASTIDHFSLPTSVVKQMQADHLELYVKRWAMTPADVGIVRVRFSSQTEYITKLREVHLRTIIGQMCTQHKHNDKTKGRELMEEDVQCTAESYFQILCDNYCQCSVCYCALTVRANLPTDLSYDRISNAHSHGYKNVRAVCSVHQAALGLLLTEPMQLHESCLQSRINVSSDARAKMIARHDDLVSDGILCPYCDVEHLE